jgi:hypothetical protein
LKNKKHFNFREANNYLALCLFGLFIVLWNCSCKKTIHNAETRPLPKVLVITTNMGEIAPDLSLEVRTSFEALPEAWYCKHYGSGAGTQPLYYSDTQLIKDLQKPVIVSLRQKKTTYCPYILEGVFLTVLTDNKLDLKKEIVLWTDRKGNDAKLDLVPSRITINCLDRKCLNFSPNEKRIDYYAIPSNTGDTLSVAIDLLN